jgi:hypothetical protein
VRREVRRKERVKRTCHFVALCTIPLALIRSATFYQKKARQLEFFAKSTLRLGVAFGKARGLIGNLKVVERI